MSEILAKVEERTRDFEGKLAAELEQYAHRLQADIAADLQQRLETVEARLRATEAEAQAELRAVANHLDKQAGARVQALERRLDEADIDGLKRRLDIQSVTLNEFEGRLQAHQRFETELSEGTRSDRAVVAELVELSRRLENDAEAAQSEFQSHAVRTAEVHSALANTLAELRGVCEVQFGKLQTEVERLISTVTDDSKSDSDAEMQQQIQALRDQLLNLSMRLSELAMNTDQAMLQQLTEEHRSDSERSRSMINNLEQNTERMALNAKAAIKQLDAKQARSEALLTAVQQQLREELSALLEELNRNRVIVNSQRFPSLTGHYGHFLTETPESGGSRPMSGSTVPSTVASTPLNTPDHRTSAGNWHHLDINQPTGPSDPRKVRDRPDDDACSLM